MQEPAYIEVVQLKGIESPDEEEENEVMLAFITYVPGTDGAEKEIKYVEWSEQDGRFVESPIPVGKRNLIFRCF